MKKLLYSLVFCFIAVLTFRQSSTYVPGYFKKDGTYVQGHYRTNQNNTNHDNWSTFQNLNPNTFQQGTRARDYSPEAYNYGQGKTIQTGPRGGQYYNNNSGNKVYVPKRNLYSPRIYYPQYWKCQFWHFKGNLLKAISDFYRL